MCYKINEHHLVHNVRPCVSYSGLQKSVELINPYAIPKPCCEQSATIASWFACPCHGCCYLTTRIVRCTAAEGHADHCDVITQYHTYQERVPLAEQKMCPSLPILDEDTGLPENSHEVFPPHRELVSELGDEVEDLGESLEQLVSDFFTTKATYNALESGWRCDAHEVCIRVLQPHECREFALREELQEIEAGLVAMECEISSLEVKFAVRRLRFDATAFGFTGSCNISNLSLKL